MRALFYPKFAYSSIKKNKKLYIPYILTSILWVMMFYIITALSASPYVAGLKGGGSLTMILGFGGPVILFFSLLFLFYTNSFLAKRRNKEYALYNILGMNKKNIAHILLWDTMITYSISIVLGLLFGTVFFKVAELGLVNIIKGEPNYNLSINWNTVFIAVLGYAVIFVFILLKSLLKIKITNPIELLRSENAGEKPPKANWFVGILGVIILGVAYYIAMTVEDPLSAMSLFFIAVMLVIIGTFLLFISGSVLLCRILQKNKKYYYKSSHFVSVSSMMHRMKRNGSGLAAICILATMVLVMIASTTSLYFGMEKSIKERYPRQMNLQFELNDIKSIDDEFIKNTDSFINAEFSKFDTKPVNSQYYKMIATGGEIENGVIDLTPASLDASFKNIYQINMVPLEDYNSITGKSETLEKNEVLTYTTRTQFSENSLSFKGGNSFHVVKHLDKFWSDGSSAMSVIPTLFIIVPDMEYATQGISSIADYNGNKMLNAGLVYGADCDLSEEKQIELYNELAHSSESLLSTSENIISINWESRANEQADFYGLYGGLFFIGIILSVLFISAAVLIIYYKQISEGYEDKSRFDIMQKVGMTKKEIRKSINSQLLTVFFMPLVFSGIHLCFAFPIIQKLLLIFNLSNILFFGITTVVSFLVFGLFYAFIYRITSNSYYKIVSSHDVD
ncbi:MAG: ABC transporter permease [Hespellia sp.]|nr:ABC transporter permease [Hespellia sp.]